MSGVLAAAAAATAMWLATRSGRQAVQRLHAAGTGRLRPYDELHGVARRWERTRQARHRDAETVTLCAALAAELRAGLPPAAALASVAGDLPLLGVRLEPAARAVGRGASLADELAVVAAGERCPRLAAVAAVCAAGESTGAGIADVLDRLGRGFAGDDESAAELAALAAGPRATAVVLAGLPVMAVALGSALGLAPLRILLHTALGMGLWLAAGLLEAAGIVWVRRITTRALRA